MLGFLVLLNDDEPSRQMGDPYRTVGRIDRLTARPAGAENIDAQILVVDPDIDLLRLGQNGHSGRRSVDAAACLGLRHALDAVHPRFEFEPGKHVMPANLRTCLLETADTSFGEVEDFE